ncbi:MAG: hypothetical protein ACE5OR_17445 [bacterium]
MVCLTHKPGLSLRSTTGHRPGTRAVATSYSELRSRITLVDQTGQSRVGADGVTSCGELRTLGGERVSLSRIPTFVQLRR